MSSIVAYTMWPDQTLFYKCTSVSVLSDIVTHFIKDSFLHFWMPKNKILCGMGSVGFKDSKGKKFKC
jgi:hypothetical protein